MKLNKDVSEKIKTDITKIITEEIEEDLQTINLYLYRDEILSEEKINIGLEKEVIAKDKTGMVFADLAPEYNWAHPCKYFLYSIDTNKVIDKFDAEFPPTDFYSKYDNYEPFHQPIKLNNIIADRKSKAKNIPFLSNIFSNAPGDRYAILFSGMSNNRHTNDLEFLYRTLIDLYEFDPNNIYVLNHDGTINYDGSPKPIGNWPGDNTPYRMPVSDQGSKVAFENVFNILKTKLKKDDLLFIHANNHGGYSNQSYLCCYPNWGRYYSSDFANKLSSLPQITSLIVMMEQCHSGGFSNPIISKSPALRTHFAAACEWDRSSIGGQNFDPFAYDWIASVTGQYADGSALQQTVDTNSDNRISAKEAFEYSDAVHHSYDTPNSIDSPTGYGAYLFLGIPRHDLFIRDNLQDKGLEPLIGGGISRSPDIIVFNQELNNPDQVLGTPEAMDRDDLGEPIEFGQNNYIYLRIHNKGTQSTSGIAKLYWAYPSTFPTPDSWNLIEELTIPEIVSDDYAIIGPSIWMKEDIPNPGHYCFICIIGSSFDPAPDTSTVDTYTEFYHLIKVSNNATWKNFNIIDMFVDSINEFIFKIKGWRNTEVISDLKFDLVELPSESEVILKVLRRLTEECSLQGLDPVKQSTLYNYYKLNSGEECVLKNMTLRAGEESDTKLTIEFPKTIAHGYYNMAIMQYIDNLEMGRITQLLAVGDHPFTANKKAHEVHKSDCPRVEKMKGKNKIAYKTLDRALKHGNNGCFYCLIDFDLDNVKSMMESIEPILIETFFDQAEPLTDEDLKILQDVEKEIVKNLKRI